MRIIVACACVALAVPASASAATAARLVYTRAPDASSCPDADAMRVAVASRVGYDPFVAFARTTVVAEIARNGKGYVGHVLLVDDRGVTRGRRDLASQAESCGPIFEAVALAISIAMDADAAPEAPAATPPPSPSPSPSPSPPPPPPPPAAAPAAMPAPSPDTVAPVARPRLFFSSSFDALLGVGFAPAPTAGGSLALQLRRGFLAFGLEGRGLLHSSSDTAGASLFAGGASACAMFDPAQFCAVGLLGSLAAEGNGITFPRSASTLFAAAGARVVVTVPIARWLSLRLGVEGLANLHRASLQIDGADAWSAPPVAGTLFGGGAFRFP